MKDVNGWLVPDGYDGCRNCAQRGVGAFCHLAAEHRESIPVCLYWEGTDDEMPMQEELREAECRLDCKPYLEYAEQKLAEYARNAVHSNNTGTTPAQERRVRERDKMRKVGRIR